MCGRPSGSVLVLGQMFPLTPAAPTMVSSGMYLSPILGFASLAGHPSISVCYRVVSTIRDDGVKTPVYS